LGAICSRWQNVARPRAFRWPCGHVTTELPSHPVISLTTLHLKPTPVTHLPGHLFAYQHKLGCIVNRSFIVNAVLGCPHIDCVLLMSDMFLRKQSCVKKQLKL